MLDPLLRFERFVVGAGNRLAAAAARRVAEGPGTSYNPLVIQGPAGLGKTHLLMAVGQLAQTLQPGLRVHYEPVEAFVDRLTASLADGVLGEFRQANGRIGLLLLDDLQDVAGRARTQEELVYLWEGLLRAGAQVVVACDRPFQEIPALDARLASRLAAGLTVEISAPEPPTRLAILRQTRREHGLALPDDVLEALARLPILSVRELQGALNRIVAAVQVEQRQLASSDVAELLGLQEPVDGPVGDEFGAFLSDISTAVAAVVETAPWRRRIAQEILRWEGEGVRTRRLEAALDADSAPDVDALLHGFARDVARLRQIRRELRAPVEDPSLFSDPDRLREAEALLTARSAPPPAPAHPARTPPSQAGPGEVDRWFLDREKLPWSWLALEERLMEEQG